jgi:methionyl-tRNA formyltransferase
LEVHPSPVKKRALELGLDVHQPKRVKTADFAQWVADKQAKVALVIAYGRILPVAVLEAPELGCVNLHASILPKYRGASPITWAIVRGENETGISLMQMDVGMDTGPVYTRHRMAIGVDETAGELTTRLGALAAQVVRADLLRVVGGELVAGAQDEASATHAPILTKLDGLIDWKKAASEVHNHIHGMQPWPGAYTRIRGKTLKILRAHVRSEQALHVPPGRVLVADSGGLVVACGTGSIEVLSLQLEGRKALSAREFVAGRGLVAGDEVG